VTTPEEAAARRQAIGQRIRAARESAGLSQGQLARLLGLHRPSLSEVEAGKRKVSAEELSTIAEHCGVSPTWLATGKEDASSDSAKVKLAARQLAKLNAGDFARVIEIVKALGTRR
jgi:transcriptional regulator with XRE-family HTH domain